ncbi:MAG TPA: tRNA (N6-threonylcarbamoyladenosine(37)-N6)-methyltransferase TrmO [Parachlamydiaceae bacterium]|nr:tRNA (N6-threonylcarbamoyladenosine(37)-N6)-methyltransferase TrmO [Parachlamydiaceae bacterium]
MDEDILQCKPIGYFHGRQSEKYMAPRQAELGQEGHNGLIVLNPGCNYEQALEDLHGFEHVWILYWFNRNEAWKPKVTTPRQGPKRGVFATRSPHRPNPIGLSCVQLLSIEGRKLTIGKNDLLDGTPILDLKPYLAYADAFPASRQGWIEEPPKNSYQVQWLPLAQEQAKFIEACQQIYLMDTVSLRLGDNPFPFKNHRIRKINENEKEIENKNDYELAVKTWRVLYSVEGDLVIIQKITSGYDRETLDGIKPSRWDDVPVHQDFLLKFPE